ncbi:MAG: hypothetical protein E7222_00020 [Clostridiales bacterium]|nr:hypothetical protein [Clostridiales bacterium]
MRRIKKLQDICIPTNQLNLIFQSRTIWRDLIIWLKAYISSKHGGFGDKDAIRAKLDQVLLNATNVFRLVFGQEHADKYVELSNDFVDLLDALIDAQLRNDADAVNEYTRKLYELPVETAEFLVQINPYWEKSQWIELFTQFNQMAIDQSTTLLNKQYKENINAFDRGLSFASRIGDYYSQGILDYLIFTGRTMQKR